MRVLYSTTTKMVNSWTSKNKLFLLLGSGVLGACGYAVYKFWKHRESKSIDEGFEDVSRVSELFNIVTDLLQLHYFILLKKRNVYIAYTFPVFVSI